MNNIVRLNIQNFYKRQSDSAASLPETPPRPSRSKKQPEKYSPKENLRLGRQCSKSKTYKKKTVWKCPWCKNSFFKDINLVNHFKNEACKQMIKETSQKSEAQVTEDKRRKTRGHRQSSEILRRGTACARNIEYIFYWSVIGSTVYFLLS